MFPGTHYQLKFKKKLKSSFEIRFYFFGFFCKIFWCWWFVWLFPHTLYVPSVTNPYTSNIYLGVNLLPPPPHTQLTSQEWWFRLIWLNSLDTGKTISNYGFTTVWSPLVSSLPDRFQTILKWLFVFLCYQIVTISNIAHWWH